MEKAAEIDGRRKGMPWRMIGWGTAALLLLLPLIAGAPWTAGDYVFAGLVFGGVGLAFELIVARSASLAYRSGAVMAVVASFLIVWANAAVGMIGDGEDGYTFLFFGVILIALAGAFAARFRPAGMALAMAIAAVAHAGVALGGMSADPRGAVFSLVLASPWLVAAALFYWAGRRETAPSPCSQA